MPSPGHAFPPDDHLTLSSRAPSVVYYMRASLHAAYFPGAEEVLQEILITIMEISQDSGVEDRIASLEKRSREMDAMVRGLLNELLDLKTISMKMTRQAGEYTAPEYTEADAPAAPAIAADGSTVIRPKGARQPEAPAAAPEPRMVRIMQADGTMKMEARYGGQDMVDSAGFARNRKNQLAARQEPLIYAAEEEKSGKDKK